MLPKNQDLKKILEKYDLKLKSRIDNFNDIQEEAPSPGVTTREYSIFKREAVPFDESLYERACNSAENIVRLLPEKSLAEKLEEAIEACHLNITPAGAMSLAALSAIFFIIVGLLIGLITYMFGAPQLFVSAFFMALGVASVKYLGSYPLYLAAKKRLRASNQMVLCILYIVVYMRHTPNLEHAIKFAGQHIGNPLAVDFKKVLWDAETGKFSTIIKSLDNYLEYWKKYNMDFVESMNLIKSSLKEGKEERRIELLEKALEVILEGTYENMLHFAQDVKSPITMLHMFGIILPLLGLIILPLLGSFMGVSWYHLFMFYNIALPVIVFFVGYNILSKRPTGYAPVEVKAAVNVNKLSAVIMAIFFVMIGFAPLIMHAVSPSTDLYVSDSFGKFLDYKEVTLKNEAGVGAGEEVVETGPFGIGALMFSLIIPLGLAYTISSYYRRKTEDLMKIREETEKIEKEFRSGLFQLGNRIGSGIPTEMAFGAVGRTLKGTHVGNFFLMVDRNVRSGGMNVERAIFDSRYGAINFFPSSIIQSTMKVLVESARKGPKIVAQALVSIATYLDRINKVTERLKDLLADVISSMKAQISFLTPVIAGIVVGIGSMITGVINKLSEKQAELASGTVGSIDFGGLGFSLADMISPFFFQLVVGLYVVEMVYVLSILSNGIQSGVDKLGEEHAVGKNLYKSAMTYVLTAFVTILVFSMLAARLAQNISV